MICHFCKKEVPTNLGIGRQDRCPHCYGDLHICRNCFFYDTAAYNDCRETSADRVTEKEKSNFCDFFRFSEAKASGAPVLDPVAEAKKKLEELFKKKS